MKKTILIVEDEIVLQDVYKIVLSSKGYDVHTADNGMIGLQLLKSLKPDVVLLDLFMPVMDGREFLRNVDLDEFNGIKIVVHSNLSDSDTKAEMLELGAHGFMLKSSMTPSDLVAAVGELVKTK